MCRLGQVSSQPGKGREDWPRSVLASCTPVSPSLPRPGRLTQHALAQASQAEVGRLEGLTPLLVQGQLLALDEDGATALQHTLRGALHHQHVPRVPGVLQGVNGQLRAISGRCSGPGGEGRGRG